MVLRKHQPPRPCTPPFLSLTAELDRFALLLEHGRVKALASHVDDTCGIARSLSASAKSSPLRHLNGDDDTSQSPGTRSGANTDQRAVLSASHTSSSGSSLVPNR